MVEGEIVFVDIRFVEISNSRVAQNGQGKIQKI